MRVVVITPPAPVVELDQAKMHLRVDGDDDDVLIAGFIAAATAHLDGPAGWLGRAIGLQTLEARFDTFLFEVDLPYRPVVSVESVSYIDVSGTLQVLAVGAYQLLGAALVPVFGTSWPAVRREREAVAVRYGAGYATIPAPISAAILLMTGDLYANRQTVETGVRAAAVTVPMSTTVEALLAPFRVYG